jgi:hypothetical protein
LVVVKAVVTILLLLAILVGQVVVVQVCHPQEQQVQLAKVLQAALELTHTLQAVEVEVLALQALLLVQLAGVTEEQGLLLQ